MPCVRLALVELTFFFCVCVHLFPETPFLCRRVVVLLVRVLVIFLLSF